MMVYIENPIGSTRKPLHLTNEFGKTARYKVNIKKSKAFLGENQDGGVGRHTAPPRTTRTDRKSNGKVSDTKEIKKKHTSRRVGGAETGTGAEKTRMALAGLRLAE